MTANPNMKAGLVAIKARSKTATNSQVNTTTIPVIATMNLVLLLMHRSLPVQPSPSNFRGNVTVGGHPPGITSNRLKQYSKRK